MVLQNESGKQIKEVQRQKVYQELDKRCTFHPEVHAPMPLLRKSWGTYNLLLIISAHCNAFPCIFCYYSQEWHIHFLEQLKVRKTRKNTERILEGCRQSRQVWFVTSLKNMTQECGKWWMEFVVVAKLGVSWKDVNHCVVMGRKEPRHKNWNRWSRSWRRWKSAHSNHQCTPSAPEKQSTLKSKV
jgi:hypothetical protein